MAWYNFNVLAERLEWATNCKIHEYSTTINSIVSFFFISLKGTKVQSQVVNSSLGLSPKCLPMAFDNALGDPIEHILAALEPGYKDM